MATTHRGDRRRTDQRGLYEEPSPWGWIIGFVLLVGTMVVLVVTNMG